MKCMVDIVSRQTALYRNWSPMRRLPPAAQLYHLAKEIVRNRERRLNPTLSEQEIEKKVRAFFR